jgi:uncharacterized protein (TIGR00251 family)
MAKRKGSSEAHGGVVLAIRVTPRARRDEIAEILADQTIKIRLTAPPVEGKANEALIQFLAKVFGVNKSKIEILAGATARDKLVSIMDVDAQQAQAIIQEQIRR